MEYIFGYIERITFQNSDNGYTVAQLKERGRRDLSCIVGTMPALQPGETVRCSGEWKRHLVHGRQFEVKEYKTEAPADLMGIKKYLGSGLIKGIGPRYADRIVEKFGTATLEIIDKTPERLEEVGGIGTKRIGKISTCWHEQKSIRDLMIFLQSYGVTPLFAQKVFKVYGNLSIQNLKDNPFGLCRDVFGIGFKTADNLANKMGLAKDAPQRIDAGIEHVLSQLSGEGHVCYPVSEFIPKAREILEVTDDFIQTRLEKIKNEGRIIITDLTLDGNLQPFVWVRSLYASEIGIAKELHRLKFNTSILREVDAIKAIEWVQSTLHIRLAPNQRIAVSTALQEKIQIITGGPGTGKSTITKAILAITDKLTKKIILAAPTGRAAKRMSEITKKKASTIHSLLEFDFKTNGFKKNRENPLDCDLIIVDEASMIDTYLMYSLLKAIPNHCRVIFVGDINQLPSVGPGNVLKDIIFSEKIPLSQLTEIFRQARGSRIVTNAHRINQGSFPDIHNHPSSDFFFMEAAENEKVVETILSLVKDRLPKKYGYDSLNDIQVLAPMKRGVCGTENLNQILQEHLTSKDQPLFRGGNRYLIGDKVMQIRNNYKKEVFNGDVGRISDIDLTDQLVIVNFEGKEISYDFHELDELQLAYAVSVHKFQGSECPCVIMPVHTSHFKLLHRNLLYTGVTRGKKLVILVGTKKAIALAVKNDEVRRRHTGLLEWMKKGYQ